MKKNKLYILISIVTLICFLGMAALCNQAGEAEDEVQAPTLKLEISEGPTFSEEDQVCYYEVEAIVTGSPEPDIEFTLDDNVSLLATEKAKVVLNDSNDTYTLEVTATNTEGSTSASINLSWGCEEEVVSEEEPSEDEEEATEDEEEVIQEGEVQEGDLFPPELSIFIHEGPIYSAADNVCYYIIASEMYGNPYPKLTWSKNDSSSMPYGMTQVNLREGETYSLTATAISEEGTVKRTLDLEWGCDDREVADADDEEVSDGDEVFVYQLNSYNAPFKKAYSGSVIFSTKDGSIGDLNTQNLKIGESSPLEWASQAFLTFDSGSINNEVGIIQSATLTINFSGFSGNTQRYTNISLGTLEWGDGAPYGSLLEKSVNVVVGTFPSSNHGDLILSSPQLKGEIQRLIDSNRLLQFKIYFTGSQTNNNDGVMEFIDYSMEGTTLNIKYNPK